MKIIGFMLLFVLLLFFSCNTTGPGGENSNAVLSLADVSCTEAWLQLTTTNLQLPTTVNLIQNEETRKTITLITADTILYVDSLLPNQTYNFYSVIQPNNQSPIRSSQIQENTLDTTGNDFTFNEYTFGGNAGSCALYDCTIISEDNIWCVGEINIADTSQNGYTLYNAVHWNGTDWQLKRIPFVFNGQNDYGPIYSIFSFNKDDIWFGSNIHWNGQEYNYLDDQALFGWVANKMWGTGSNDLYAVGNGGHIAHYQNGVWSKIESGTSLQFLDIYGATDTQNGDQQILAVCTQNNPPGNGIYTIKGNTVTEISSKFNFPGYTIPPELFGIWFVPYKHYYIIGDGIYEKRLLSDSTWGNGPLEITRYATTGIRGTGINDVFVSGAFGEFLHFNGVRWESFINNLGQFSGSYGSLAIKNNLVVTVGYVGEQAKILVGHR